MNKLEFEREYFSKWIEPDPKYELAFKSWLEYYYQTELYDRRICSGIDTKTGNAMPTSTVEYIDINRNAKRLMNGIILELRDKEIDDKTWKRARDAASKYSHCEVEKLLTSLESK